MCVLVFTVCRVLDLGFRFLVFVNAGDVLMPRPSVSRPLPVVNRSRLSLCAHVYDNLGVFVCFGVRGFPCACMFVFACVRACVNAAARVFTCTCSYPVNIPLEVFEVTVEYGGDHASPGG